MNDPHGESSSSLAEFGRRLLILLAVAIGAVVAVALVLAPILELVDAPVDVSRVTCLAVSVAIFSIATDRRRSSTRSSRS